LMETIMTSFFIVLIPSMCLWYLINIHVHIFPYKFNENIFYQKPY
jgi:hypothetical protein